MSHALSGTHPIAEDTGLHEGAQTKPWRRIASGSTLGSELALPRCGTEEGQQERQNEAILQPKSVSSSVSWK